MGEARPRRSRSPAGRTPPSCAGAARPGPGTARRRPGSAAGRGRCRSGCRSPCPRHPGRSGRDWTSRLLGGSGHVRCARPACPTRPARRQGPRSRGGDGPRVQGPPVPGPEHLPPRARARRGWQRDVLPELHDAAGPDPCRGRGPRRRDGFNELPTGSGLTRGACFSLSSPTCWRCCSGWRRASRCSPGCRSSRWRSSVIVLLNGFFAFWQEYRADRSTAATAARCSPAGSGWSATARPTVDARELVADDVVLLAAGDRVGRRHAGHRRPAACAWTSR